MHPYPQMNAALLYPYTLYPPLGRMGLGDSDRRYGWCRRYGTAPPTRCFTKARPGAGPRSWGVPDDGIRRIRGLVSKRRAAGQDVIFRMIVPSKQIGRVIGKEGCRIRQIREETGATIKIADPIVPHEERVIIISSAVDEGKISNAEAALNYIAKAILKDNEDGGEAVIVGTGHVAVNAIRLLIAGSQAGCLIGVSGQTIEQIRNSSGAAVTILAPNQLPLCASAHESDRVVQLSGDVPEILTALEKIGCVLRDNPSTKVISIRSGYHSSVSVSNPPNTQVPPGEYMTSEMTIMEKFVGGLIGRNGYNISRIRNVSGATVKVTGQKGENTRQIFFGVAVARMLVENYMYSQLVPQNVM
ncbi:unnamed protein product [Spirodela intermedia]|uniref:K Homology domain-containing protein n=1 Tax=Spirodela intermedia TaxID=51605 RepID=A0A7I8IH07_SPIIN|nr:unnamed protein product [Spirodela intermedia]CAA6657072.1 unnamed protein product [Spirodela intermedia]